MAVSLARGLTNPIVFLTREARQFVQTRLGTERGNSDASHAEISSRDEIRELTQAFQEMSTAIDSHLEQLTQLNKAGHHIAARWLTYWLALCWIHEGRHYKKLEPVVALHQTLLKDFLGRFWAYYDQLMEYRQRPTAQEALRLEAEFDALFDTPSGYAQLDKRMASTRSNKGSLLLVLKFPELPLHNNPAELGARGRVRKRDVSFGPRTEDGKQAWDTFMTLATTTKKLNISFYEYVRDRILKKNAIPPLSDLITKAAHELLLGQSYSLACP